MVDLLKFYYELDPKLDLDPDIVRSRLEVLTEAIPTSTKSEYNRCYLNGFLRMLDASYIDEDGKRLNVPFFSETPQRPLTHFRAFGFSILFNLYASNLGSLMRENGVDPSTKYKIARPVVGMLGYAPWLYDNVTKLDPDNVDYQPLLGGMPDLKKRDDLKRFYMLLRG